MQAYIYYLNLWCQTLACCARMRKFKDPDFMGQFIDKYRDMHNLWEVKNPLYLNKTARKASLEKLLQFVKMQVPDADIDFVDRKIGSSLEARIGRSLKRSRLHEIRSSCRGCVCTQSVFLEDQIEVRESLSTLPSSLPSTLPSTPAEASEDQPGPFILEEVEEPSWSQEDLSQDEALECVESSNKKGQEGE
ncbi:hypothetical protein AB205_0027040 [Aquarana catesbeiana]|uniref:MADF domain-containing protein n=1 Tax=Aquarana catesbeiana TaxID=8400 RepID=A0A2G9SLB9_AQUCT|nr:hypothetical protein AB205_0027040 [Aquarana catesbeiana]